MGKYWADRRVRGGLILTKDDPPGGKHHLARLRLSLCGDREILRQQEQTQGGEFRAENIKIIKLFCTPSGTNSQSRTHPGCEGNRTRTDRLQGKFHSDVWTIPILCPDRSLLCITRPGRKLMFILDDVVKSSSSSSNKIFIFGRYNKFL